MKQKTWLSSVAVVDLLAMVYGQSKTGCCFHVFEGMTIPKMTTEGLKALGDERNFKVLGLVTEAWLQKANCRSRTEHQRRFGVLSGSYS